MFVKKKRLVLLGACKNDNHRELCQKPTDITNHLGVMVTK